MQFFNVQKKILPESSEAGQGLVEFSMILLILLGTFLGAFEVFNLYQQRTEVETVTQRTVRQAAESYIDKVNSEAEITEYAALQFESMGYDRTYIDNNIVVKIEGYTYDEANQKLVPIEPAVSYCVYGDYIAIRITKPLETSVIPLDTFFEISNSSQNYTAEEVNRCWRGS